MDYADQTTLTSGDRHILCGLAPWDEETFGFRVAAILDVQADGERLTELLDRYRHWCVERSVAFSSVRLPIDAVERIHALTDAGFRFVEVVLHPTRELTPEAPPPDRPGAVVREGQEQDLASLQAIAETTFNRQRLYLDPTFPNALASRRYEDWVARSWANPAHRFLVLEVEGRAEGFWIYEMRPGRKVWLHLTAIGSRLQGQGFGTYLWRSACARLGNEGATRIDTRISLANEPVMSLYSKLGWRFKNPEATLHLWSR